MHVCRPLGNQQTRIHTPERKAKGRSGWDSKLGHLRPIRSALPLNYPASTGVGLHTPTHGADVQTILQSAPAVERCFVRKEARGLDRSTLSHSIATQRTNAELLDARLPRIDGFTESDKQREEMDEEAEMWAGVDDRRREPPSLRSRLPALLQRVVG